MPFMSQQMFYVQKFLSKNIPTCWVDISKYCLKRKRSKTPVVHIFCGNMFLHVKKQKHAKNIHL